MAHPGEVTEPHLTLRPASDLRREIAEGHLGPVELVEASLARVEALNDELGAMVTLNPQALDDARELERRQAAGETPGPLHGLPVGIKDVTEVAGLRTTYGSPLFADNVPAEDALVVQRFRQAGAIILGKTNTPEFAAGGNTWNAVFGRTRNPWNTDRSAGGSTGGGAVGLATGMIAFAEGTDLGGSLRIPASFCGIVGMRPSAGLVPTVPTDYLWDSFQVTGTMARTAEDLALALQAVAGPSPRSPMRQPTLGRDFVAAARAGAGQGLKVAYCPDIAGIGIDPAVEAACREAAFELTQAGVTVEEIELDLSHGRRDFLALRGLWFVTKMFPSLRDRERFGINVANNIASGLEVSSLDIATAEQGRARLWETFRGLFERYDHLLTPTMAVPPFPVEENFPQTIAGKEMETYIDWLAPTFVLSLTGLPIASVPAGLDPGGLPVGLQIVARPEGEEEALALAKTLQDARPIGLPPAYS